MASQAKEAAPVAPDAAAPGTTTDTVGTVSRSLVYRGDMSIRVQDVEAAAAKVQALATSLKGNLASEKRSLGNQSAFASLTIRVPSESFTVAMDRLSKEIGREETRSSNTEDVTEAVIDLDVRIASARDSEAAARKLLLERSGTLDELLKLDNAVRQRQAELAALEAKKRHLDDIVSLSTITVNIAGPNTALPETPKERSPGFLGGLEAGWDAFVDFGIWLGYAIGAMLPFLVALAILLLGAIYGLRYRRNRSHPADAPSTTD
jgi:hypothetical protein